jgi:hypothetical protein
MQSGLTRWLWWLALAGAGLLAVVGYVAVRGWQPALPAEPGGRALSPAVVRSVLYLVVILTLTLAVSLLAFLRWSRHFRRWMLRGPQRRTPDSDVWKMHRLPDEENGSGDSRLTEPGNEPG